MEMGFPSMAPKLFHFLLQVDCRIGSLERWKAMQSSTTVVDCRIGSLEIMDTANRPLSTVDCRIGSLENTSLNAGASATVDCRIGGRIGTPAGMQEGKMKKAPLAGAFFDGLFSPLVCSLWSGLCGR